MLARERITQERKKKGWNIIQMAQKLGITQATLSRYESGMIKTIPMEMFKKIAAILECSVDYLASDDPQYRYLASEKPTTLEFESEDIEIIRWYHGLPEEVRKYVRHLACMPLD